jgi:hypothetical protein
MDEFQGHDAEWNMSVTKDHKIYGFTYMKYLEEPNTYRQNADRIEVTRARGRGLLGFII